VEDQQHVGATSPQPLRHEPAGTPLKFEEPVSRCGAGQPRAGQRRRAPGWASPAAPRRSARARLGVGVQREAGAVEPSFGVVAEQVGDRIVDAAGGAVRVSAAPRVGHAQLRQGGGEDLRGPLVGRWSHGG
jgi:hypothetical protein